MKPTLTRPVVLLCLALTGCLLGSDTVTLRERPDFAPERSRLEAPRLLVLALDGVDRDLVYRLLREGRLPHLARLLGGYAGETPFPHAFFAEDVLTTLPSSTAIAWTSAFTGEPPAEHGVVGNEYFLRDTREFVAPVPVSIRSVWPALANWTEGYWNGFVRSPTVYERLRHRDPSVKIWVGVHPIYAGADHLLLPDRTVLLAAAQHFFVDSFLEEVFEDEEQGELYRSIDAELVDQIGDSLDEDSIPDVLTVYLAGADQLAHLDPTGPDPVRVDYLTEHVDDLCAELYEELDTYGFFADTYVLLVSDHGHSRVPRDTLHALSDGKPGDPPEILAAAGFHPRPATMQLEPGHERFDAVFACQGAMAFLYLADRTTMAAEGQHDWTKPPRLEEDVLPAVKALHQASREGNPDGFKRALELILVRDEAVTDGPPLRVFEGARTMPTLAEWVEANPDTNYVDLLTRMQRLTQGSRGRDSGDVILLASNASCARYSERFYFAGPCSSWHGSPSARDSQIPFVVAHTQRTTAEIAARVRPHLGANPSISSLTPVMLDLRHGEDTEEVPD